MQFILSTYLLCAHDSLSLSLSLYKLIITLIPFMRNRAIAPAPARGPNRRPHLDSIAGKDLSFLLLQVLSKLWIPKPKHSGLESGGRPLIAVFSLVAVI